MCVVTWSAALYNKSIRDCSDEEFYPSDTPRSHRLFVFVSFTVIGCCNHYIQNFLNYFKRIPPLPIFRPHDLFSSAHAIGKALMGLSSLPCKTYLQNPLNFTSSFSETQETEECLSHTNAALKQVTVELQSAKQELEEVINTKNSVMKELSELQLTLAGKQK